ncbi:MAG: hypothetical protein M3Z66_22555 [Chloroflexota bacterium]|nr:hypothetical protein [Chloroflexota bacterium]
MAPAHLTAEQAVEVAKQSFKLTLFDHPYTVEYGSFDDSNQSRGGVPIGIIDAWKIRITGLSLPPPSGPSRPGLPVIKRAPYTTVVIIIADQEARYLRAEAHL